MLQFLVEDNVAVLGGKMRGRKNCDERINPGSASIGSERLQPG
jgi:hypothetical protein